MPIPVIIDTDPGLDDALALMLAFASEELDIKGVVSVCGNQSIDKTTANAAKVISLAGKNINLIQGAKGPLIREQVYAADIHGESGLGTSVLKEAMMEIGNEACEFIYAQARQNVKQLEIIALGPLTNIAKVILQYPDIKDCLKRIVLMGGGHAFGNVTPSAEFNIYADPEAARIVFESGIPLMMVGLDATHDISIHSEEVETLFQGDNHIEKILKQFLKDMIFACEHFFNLGEAHLHDLLAVIATYDQSVVQGSYHHVDIETKGTITYGKTVVDIYNISGKEKNAFVALQADKKKVMEIIADKFRKYA